MEVDGEMEGWRMELVDEKEKQRGNIEVLSSPSRTDKTAPVI